MKKLLLLFLTYSLCISRLLAQQHRLDSLKQVYQAHPNDTSGIHAMTHTANLYLNANDYVNSIQMAKRAIALSNRLHYNNWQGHLYKILASSYERQGNIGDALKHSYIALRYFEQSGDSINQGNMLQTIGVAYNYMGKIDAAIATYKKAYILRKSTHDVLGLATTSNTIGHMMLKLNRVDTARVLFYEALKLFKELGDSTHWGFPFTYGCIGVSYDVVADSLNDDGKLQQAMPYYIQSLEYYNLAITGWAKAGNPGGVIEAKLNAGNVLGKMGKCKEARKVLEAAIEGALKLKTGNFNHVKNGYAFLSDMESNCGYHREALEHFKSYIHYRDLMINDENRQQALQSEMQYEFDKKAAVSKAVEEKRLALDRAEIKKQKVVRNYALIGAVGILLFGGFAFYNFRKKKQVERLQALANERQRISRELHDDIGSTLGSIAVYSDVASHRAMKNENAQEVLSKIGSASRELIDKMGDIIWSLNPEQEDMEHLFIRMQSFAAMTLVPQKIKVNFNFDETLNEILLTNDQRRHIFLIFKESIHNIIKYASCKNVTISLNRLTNKMVFTINDDGVGFENHKNGHNGAYNGNGLKNIRSRAGELGAAIKISSEKNIGTSVELELSI